MSKTPLSFKDKFFHSLTNNDSTLVVGLDVDESKIPSFLCHDKYPLLSFSKYIIDATYDKVIAYKPNSAFFEAYGLKGMDQLRQIIAYIPNEIPVILDVKRGDIGNSAQRYAKAAYEDLKVDAVTLNAYMGSDAVIPFCNYKDKYQFMLVLTSNPGAKQIQMLKTESGEYVFERMAQEVAKLDQEYQNCGVVVGATYPEQLSTITDIAPDSYLLIPGVGTQGGSIKDVLSACTTNKNQCLINVSRDILYAGNDKDFAKAAANKADAYRMEINKYRHE
jgi:orotidine-5'-phosphate decarboxylase